MSKVNNDFNAWAKTQFKTNQELAEDFTKITKIVVSAESIRTWRIHGTPRLHLRPLIEKFTDGKVKAWQWF